MKTKWILTFHCTPSIGFGVALGFGWKSNEVRNSEVGDEIWTFDTTPGIAIQFLFWTLDFSAYVVTE